MKHKLMIIAVVLLVGITACKPSGQKKDIDDATDTATVVIDSAEDEHDVNGSDSILATSSRSLNEIRFDGWSESDWYDNEYIRTLREYIDKVANGEIEDEDLKPYKDILRSKFINLDIQDFLYGGLFLRFVFIDQPQTVFETNVYSYVDEDTETVTDYEVRGVRPCQEEIDLTKEEILQVVKEHPENKLW